MESEGLARLLCGVDNRLHEGGAHGRRQLLCLRKEQAGFGSLTAFSRAAKRQDMHEHKHEHLARAERTKVLRYKEFIRYRTIEERYFMDTWASQLLKWNRLVLDL